jgi:4-hydroxythreonine-4-phosphate dehydrogenase
VLHPGPQAGDPKEIAAALAATAAYASEHTAVAGLVLTGGDTAVHVARRLGATGLRVEDELEPGVVLGRLVGPRPYRTVTKAGGFGSPDALRRASAALAAAGSSRA